ncbi:hypothetical protein CP365_07345 [Lactobacillus sp. UMNPBX14]|nr:hypothetical protein CP365_07345 [Lactobacillus sp. UMNPBX14]
MILEKSSFLLSYFLQRRMRQKKYMLKYLPNKYFGYSDDFYFSDDFSKQDIDKYSKKVQRGKADFRFISVPNFFEDVKGNKKTEVELEKDIIDQLLLTSKPMQFPDSSISRLVQIKLQYIFIIYMVLCFYLLLLINGKLD